MRIQSKVSAGVLGAALLLALYGAGRLQAFAPGPLRWSPGDNTHETITRRAIDVVISKQLEEQWSTSVEEAVVQIVDANKRVDDDQDHPPLHFDGECLQQGQRRLKDHLGWIVDDLSINLTSMARDYLGSALHTLQDFYSHSNWIDRGKRDPLELVGSSAVTLRNPSARDRACKDCWYCNTCANDDANLVATYLTTGYYTGERNCQDTGPGPQPAGKCSHGGVMDQNFATTFMKWFAAGASLYTPPAIVLANAPDGINKDSSKCWGSPHEWLHDDASRVAETASFEYLLEIQYGLVERGESFQKFRRLLGLGTTLTFCIDCTGSMQSVIDQVQEVAYDIIDDRIGTPEEPTQYVLVPFGDPTVGPVTVTDDPDEFKRAIAALDAAGGNDCPERAMSGMNEALEATDEGGTVFLFTDADAKDEELTESVASQANNKGIDTYCFLFGACGYARPPAGDSSGAAPQSQSRTEEASLEEDNAFYRLAEATGGQTFLLEDREAARITELADLLVRSDSVRLLSTTRTLEGVAQEETVPVDGSLSRVTFSVSGAESLQVFRPDGSAVSAGDPDVQLIEVSGGVIIAQTRPPPGDWRITVDGSGHSSIVVSGESGLNLGAVQFLRPGGRPGHWGYMPAQGYPVAGRPTMLGVRLRGEIESAEFELRGGDGTLLETLPLTRGADLEAEQFLGEVVVPREPFVVQVRGRTSSGSTFQRVRTNRLEPQTVQLTAPDSVDLPLGLVRPLSFSVTNYGETGSFHITVADRSGFVFTPPDETLFLERGATATVSLELRAYAGLEPGRMDRITLTATREDESSSNYAIVRAVAIDPPSSGCGGCSSAPGGRARASSIVLWMGVVWWVGRRRGRRGGGR